jgi:hypothetical protein
MMMRDGPELAMPCGTRIAWWMTTLWGGCTWVPTAIHFVSCSSVLDVLLMTLGCFFFFVSSSSVRRMKKLERGSCLLLGRESDYGCSLLSPMAMDSRGVYRS